MDDSTNPNKGLSMNREAIAKLCHEVNRAYCACLGDTSQPAWDDAPSWQRDSAMGGVSAILHNPHMTPEQSHQSWLEQKRIDGWRYGETKDPEAKTHPCFVPYSKLPLAQRAKDYIFTTIVKELASYISHADAGEGE